MRGAIMKSVCALIILLPLTSACASRHLNESPPATESPQGMLQIEARMQHMQRLMDRIQKTDDAQERQRLMQEHVQSMQQSMTMMRRMMREQRGEFPAGQVGDTDEAAPDETEGHVEHH
jgi:hypothetical protein